MSHKILRPFIAKVSVLCYLPLLVKIKILLTILKIFLFTIRTAFFYRVEIH